MQRVKRGLVFRGKFFFDALRVVRHWVGTVDKAVEWVPAYLTGPPPLPP